MDWVILIGAGLLALGVSVVLLILIFDLIKKI